MRLKEWRLNAPEGACCLLALSVPFLFVYGAACIWLLALAWIFRAQFLGTLRNLRAIHFWLWTAYFLLHAASYLYSTDKEQSLFDTVSKLSFVLLPLLIGAGTPLKIQGIGAILLFFIASLLLTEAYCLWQAYSHWRGDHIVDHFFYHELTRGLDANAVYMAWYVCGALAALLLFPWGEAGIRWMLYLRWPVLLLFSGFLLLLASRLMLVIYPLLIIPAFGIRLFSRYKLWLVVPLLAIGVGFGSLYLLSKTQNPIHKRFSDIMHPDMSTVIKEDYAGNEPSWTNLTLRAFVWRVALENMEVHHLWWRGTGNGDAYLYQNARIAGHGIAYMQVHSPQRSTLYKINLHNMYLQSLLMFGLPGLLIFILLTVAPLFILRRAGGLGWFFGIFHLTSILFFMQESALQTQAGVIYYCFFTSVFWAAVKRGEKGGRMSNYQKVIQ